MFQDLHQLGVISRKHGKGFLELFGRVVLGHVGEEHPPEQGVSAGDLLLADPVVHDAQVWVVGGQEPQQGRVQPLGTSGTFTAQL